MLKRFLPVAALSLLTAMVCADEVSERNAAFAAALDAKKAATGQASIATAKIDEMSTQLMKDGVTSIIVTLRQPQAFRTMEAKDWNMPTKRSELHNQSKATVDAVLARVGKRVKPQYRYDNWAGFSTAVDSAGLEALLTDPDVMNIQVDETVEINTAQGLPLINAMTATRNGGTYDGRGVSIAIVDTGIDYNHKQLGGTGSTYATQKDFPNSKVIGGYNFGDASYPNDPSPYAGNTAGHAHGTSCAGTAAGNIPTADRTAEAANYIGGVAPGAKLYGLKVTPGATTNASFSTIYAAWNWCITNKDANAENPILIISTSMGGGRYYSPTDASDTAGASAANAAISAGITLFVASANDGFCDSIGAPASLSNAIAVGAVYDANLGSKSWTLTAGSCIKTDGGIYTEASTTADQVCSYSNSHATMLDIFAPSADNATTMLNNGFRQNFNGTSAACPYAAGTAAALQSAAKQILGRYLTAGEVKTYLTSTGDPVTDWKATNVTKPRVNLGAAIQALDTTQPPLNDAFADAEQIGTNGTKSASNANATLETGEPNHGYASVWYKLSLPLGNITLNNTSTGDSRLTIYTGSAVNALTQVAQIEKGAAATWKTPAASNVYYLAVTALTEADAGNFAFTYAFEEIALITMLTPTAGAAFNTTANSITFKWNRELAFSTPVYVWFCKMENGVVSQWGNGYTSVTGGMDDTIDTCTINVSDILAEKTALGLSASDSIYWNMGSMAAEFSKFGELKAFTPPTTTDKVTAIQVIVDGSTVDLPATWPSATAMTAKLTLSSDIHVVSISVNESIYTFDDRVAADTDGSRVVGLTAPTAVGADAQVQAAAGYVAFTIAADAPKTFSINGTAVPIQISGFELE